MIKLLTAHSLTVRNRFKAERFSLNLSERQSTATITIGPEAPTISVGDWLQDEDNPGKGIVWRVKSVGTDYATETRTIQCDHLITGLKDVIMFGETKPGTMAGNSKAKTCTAKQAAEYILKKQKDWALGSFGFSKSAEYNFNGDSLYDALETVSGSLLNAWWAYDFSSYPFKLSINKQSTAVACEMRADRNIKTLKKTVDRTRMYTRFYPIGKNNLKLPGEYVEKNANLYGVISKVETDNAKDSVAQLQDWAEEKLNNHAEPLVTVTISGLELSAATGESLDKLVLGTVCRVPLPEFSTTITERITRLSWSDKIADGESVTVTLANNQEDVASIVNNLIKSGGGGGRAQAKNDEEDHAWFVDTTDHVGMIAEAVAGEGADKDWSRVSSVIVDGQGIHQRVVKAEKDIVTAEGKIEVNEKLIEAEVTERKKEGANLRGAIDVTSTKVGMVVGTHNGTNYIKSAEICVAINNDSSTSATIRADKIYLLGQTIADTINAEFIETQVALIPNLRVKQLTAATSIGWEGSGTVITGSQAADIVRNLRIQSSGNTYTLQKVTCGDASWTDVGSFSRAITSWLVGGGSGKVNVTALPQNQAKSVNVSIDGTPRITANGDYVYKVDYENGDGDDVPTGAQKTVTVDVKPDKTDIGASRGARQSGQPSTDGTLSGVTANGWYVITVSVLGTTKTYRIEVDV